MNESKKPPSHQKSKITRSVLNEGKKRHNNTSDSSKSSLSSRSRSTSPFNTSGKGGIERYKWMKNKNPVMALDDTCVLPLLRTSFVQDYLGELKTDKRKFVSVRNVRKSAVRNFGTMFYKKTWYAKRCWIYEE